MNHHCIGCGCTEFQACATPEGPCYWLVPPESGLGLCSECEQFAADLQAVSAGIATPFFPQHLHQSGSAR